MPTMALTVQCLTVTCSDSNHSVIGNTKRELAKNKE
jgi:hypothetical protein